MKYCRELGIFCVLFALSGIAESLSLSDFFGHGPQESAYYGPHGPPPPPRPYRGHPVKYVSYGKPSYGPRPTVIRYVSKRPSSGPHLSPYSVVSESLSGGGWGGPPPSSYSSGGKPSSRPRGRPAPRQPVVMPQSMDEDEYASQQAPEEDISGMMDITNMDLTSEGPMVMTQDPNSETEMFNEDMGSQSAPLEDGGMSGGEGETSSSPAPEEPMIMMMQAPRRPSSSSGKKPSSRGKKPSSKPTATYGWDDEEGFSQGGPEYFYEDVYSYDGPEGWGWGPPSSGGSSSGGPPSSGGSSSGGPPAGSAGSGGVTDTAEGGFEGTGVNDGLDEEEVVVRTTARPRPAAPRRPTSSGRAASRPATQRPAAQRPTAAPARPASSGRGASSASSSASRAAGSSGGSAQLQDARPQVSSTSGRSAGGSGGNAQQQSANGGAGGASGGANMPLTSQFRDAGESSGAPEGAYGVPGRQAGQPLGGTEVSSNTGDIGRLQVQKSISSDNQELSNLSGQLDADLLRIVQQIISETKV